MDLRSGFAARNFRFSAIFLVAAVLCGCGGDTSTDSTGSSSTGNGGNDGGGGGGGGTAAVTVQWDAPITNTDQSCIAALGGFIVSYGESPGLYSKQVDVPLAGANCANSGTSTSCGSVLTCSHQLAGLAAGNWYFTVTVYDSDLSRSETSNEASVTID
jgi:hypothetical protein